MGEEENNKETNVKASIDAVTGLVKAIPVYQDAVQPSAKEIGKSLETVTKTINIALAPIKALVWGYEQIEKYVTQKVAEKLKDTPKENIVTPQPEIAGPTFEALRFSGHNENLRELYANLLATAMDKESLHKAHPAYVEIIKGITSDEAILLKAFLITNIYPIVNLKEVKDNGYNIIYTNFSKFPKQDTLNRPDLVPTYISNLCRLSILEIPWDSYLSAKDAYTDLENDEYLSSYKQEIVERKHKVEFSRKIVQLTAFGKQFIENVVAEK